MKYDSEPSANIMITQLLVGRYHKPNVLIVCQRWRCTDLTLPFISLPQPCTTQSSLTFLSTPESLSSLWGGRESMLGK